MDNPFEIIKAFHTKGWDKIRDRDKARNLFMINRTCSIAYPMQANSVLDLDQNYKEREGKITR